MSNLYIGLMSGTSMDGIDAALVRFGDRTLDILATGSYDYPVGLRRQLLEARADCSLRATTDVPALHRAVGAAFRDAARHLIEQAGVDPAAVAAIGSHGQTLRHAPDADPPYSLQIGDPAIISAGTGVTTIADFRRADIELGGQGAPLAPAFHEWLFRREGGDRVVLNIGGIANITVLYGDRRDTIGFDTGPGNTLLDAWARRQGRGEYDADGRWSAAGTVIDELLARLQADPYFSAPPPKSTGFEYFNLDWLDAAGVAGHEPSDVQATLCQLTANSIAAAIVSVAANVSEVLVCGGGIHNSDMITRLGNALPGVDVSSTATAGLEPGWVEAAAFAWLAMRTSRGLPGNLPSVTGAARATVLGTVHRAELPTG